MLASIRRYVAYKRQRRSIGRELRGDRRLHQRPNIEDAAEIARSDQEYRPGPLSGRTRQRPPVR
jgi:hypothetical protein